MDNYHTHKHAEVEAWLARHRRVKLHFTPTSRSWLNLVEVFFGIVTRQAIRRGTFTSVKDLVAAISHFIDGWNERCHPFIWTKTADEILPHARQRTSDPRHYVTRGVLTSLACICRQLPHSSHRSDPHDHRSVPLTASPGL